MAWYFSMSSNTYGSDEFGPYKTKSAALTGIARVMSKAADLSDGVERQFSAPYKKQDG